jgi:hypothetical protein
MKSLTRKTKTKTKTKTKPKTKTKTKTKTPYAGEAIAAGGYGCVFKPPIKCNDSTSTDEHGISKLMLKRHVRSEMDEIDKIKPYIDKIPNNKRYFLVEGITSCNPDKLTKSDKVNFNNKCNNLTQLGIEKRNVNKKLNDLAMINIPYGGKDMDTYWKWLNETLTQVDIEYWKLFASTNNSLIRLLKYGILPLNAQHFLHMDIKGGNVLRGGDDRSTDCNCRLIDWGLAETYTPLGNIPEDIEDKVIQYNIPFSIILFGTNTIQNIKDELKETNTKLQQLNKNSTGNKSILKIISYNILQKSMSEVGEGHIDFILKYILPGIFKNQIYKGPSITNGLGGTANATNLTFGSGIICDYIAEILFTFAKRGSNGEIIDIDIQKYFLDVFVHNVDIWGFIMCYLPIIEDRYSEFGGVNTPWNNVLTNGIARIFIKYCFSPTYAATKIPINELINDLLSLNTFGGLSASLKLYKPVTTVKKKPKTKLVLIDKLSSSKKASTTRKQKAKKPNSSQERRRELVDRGNPFTWEGPGRKRCPKGSRRNSRGKCIKK